MYSRLYGRAKCNRPINFEEGDFFSPGEYEIEIDGESIRFDYKNSEFGTEPEDNTVIGWEQEYFDESCSNYSESSFCKSLLEGDIDCVNEFFLFCGEYDDPEYQIVDILHAVIEVVDDEGEIHEYDITEKARISRFYQEIREKTEKEMQDYYNRIMKMKKVELWHMAFAIDSKQRLADYFRNLVNDREIFLYGRSEKDTADFLKWIRDEGSIDYLYNCYIEMNDACICTHDNIFDMLRIVYQTT